MSMRFDIITLFPNMFDSYFDESILKRAQEIGVAHIAIHNLRDYTHDKHKTVDDTPYGGGAGMVIKVEPVTECVEAVAHQDLKRRIILFSAKGKQFTEQDALRLSQYEQVICICGRYEGVDERVAEYVADEEVSIGPYVLTGGEIPAMVVVDAVTRLLAGVLGNPNSLDEESHGKNFSSEYPQYTRPENFRGWKIPDVLQSGDHAEIAKWRTKHARSNGISSV